MATTTPEIEVQLRLPKQPQQQPAVLMLDAGALLERPCSSNSADSISASEAFSTAALESDTSEGHHEAPGRQPGMYMQVCAGCIMLRHAVRVAVKSSASKVPFLSSVARRRRQPCEHCCPA
jgi:hypothetical protein